MQYFIKNTRKFVILSFLLLVILAAIGYFSLSLSAQGILDPRAMAEADAKANDAKRAQDLFGSVDIEELAYSKDKDGCGSKSAMFFVMSARYIAGDSADDVAGSKMLLPLVETVYDKIKKNGLENATLNNMIEYQDCIANAKPHRNPSREYDLSLKHGACVKLNAAILDTLDAIKRRKSVSRVMDKYENEEVDFTGTLYEDIPNPIILFIGKLYETSKNGEYKDAVMAASGISVACYG